MAASPSSASGARQPLGRCSSFRPAPGWVEEYLHGFLARDCTPAWKPGDADEHIQVERYSLSDALDLARDGWIEDAKTILMLQALALRVVGFSGEERIRCYRGDE